MAVSFLETYRHNYKCSKTAQFGPNMEMFMNSRLMESVPEGHARFVLQTRWRRLGEFLIGAFVLAFANSLEASQLLRADTTAVDCNLTLFVRDVLQQDDHLGRFNLGADVAGRVATLWGPVPSAALAKRAEELVHRVTGVAGIRNELRIEPVPDWEQKIIAQPGTPSVPFQAATYPGEEPKFYTALTSRSIALPQPTSAWLPIVVTLRPPILCESCDLPTRPMMPAPESLAMAVAQIRLADDRFRLKRTEVKEGIVVLRGTVARWEDLFEMAQAVAQLPGVERVLLKDVHTPQAGTLWLP
jgi:hypothetical protein